MVKNVRDATSHPRVQQHTRDCSVGHAEDATFIPVMKSSLRVMASLVACVHVEDTLRIRYPPCGNCYFRLAP